MRIKDLPEPVKTFALNNQEKQSYPRDPEKDVNDFYWADTPEGTDFWVDVYDGIFSFNSLAKKYDTLDWGFQVEGNIQTDNSKVNENLLKENEELKLKLKSIESILDLDLTDKSNITIGRHFIRISPEVMLTLDSLFEALKREFFKTKEENKAEYILSDIDPLVKKELRKLLNQD